MVSREYKFLCKRSVNFVIIGMSSKAGEPCGGDTRRPCGATVQSPSAQGDASGAPGSSLCGHLPEPCPAKPTGFGECSIRRLRLWPQTWWFVGPGEEPRVLLNDWPLRHKLRQSIASTLSSFQCHSKIGDKWEWTMFDAPYNLPNCPNSLITASGVIDDRKSVCWHVNFMLFTLIGQFLLSLLE